MPRADRIAKARAIAAGAQRDKPGPPKLHIDWGKVGNLCAAGASGASIAHDLGIAADTLYIRCQEDLGLEFSTFKRQHHERGDDLIRTKQFDLAVNSGNERLLIFLGKNRLGQRDRVEMTGANGDPIPAVTIQVLPVSPNAGHSEG